MNSEISFITSDLKILFENLKNGKHEDQRLYEILHNTLNKIEKNPMSGIQIPKKLIPKVYIKKYSLRNLWKYNMPRGYRLLYSIKSDGIVIVAIIVEWLPHKEYDERFNY